MTPGGGKGGGGLGGGQKSAGWLVATPDSVDPLYVKVLPV